MKPNQEDAPEVAHRMSMGHRSGGLLSVLREFFNNDSWKSLKSVIPLLGELIRPRRRYFVTCLLLVIASRGAALVSPLLISRVIDAVIAKRASELLPLLLLMLTGSAVGTALSIVTARLMFTEGLRLTAELRCRVHNHVIRLPVPYYDQHKSGKIAKRIMDDASGGRTLLGPQVIDFLGALVTSTFAFMALLFISWTLTLAALAFGALFAVVSSQRFSVVHSHQKNTLEVAADLHGRVVEAAAGVRVVKGYRAEAREGRMFSREIDRLNDVTMRTFRAGQLQQALSPMAMSIFMACVMFLAAHQILDGRLTVGQLASFMALLGFLMGPMLQAATLAGTLGEGLAGLARAQELLAMPTEDANPRRTVTIGPITGNVRFDDVSFSYDPGVNVLKHVSFDCRPGTSTALVGPSGAGKSTIINLMAAFYDATEGTISIDGVDLSTINLDAYRTQLGVVFQDNFLFAGTIRENVAFAKPDASMAEILEACRLAHVDEFVERFPKQYETVIGERGVKISGGQRQRIAIARAILADPRILILDEATSSLDSESEAAIQAGLHYLMQGRTTLIIAHRLSTIRNADQILFVEHGEIIERGVHQTLYAKSGRYHDLCKRQYQAGSDAAAAMSVSAAAS